MEVIPSGYKQTEAGVIPEDWDIKRLGEIFAFSGGLSASRAQLSDIGHCYLHYGDIHLSDKTYIDVEAEILDIPKLDVSLADVSSAALLKDGDIVFVDASEDDDGTSKHLVVVNPEGRPYISGLHTIVAKSKGKALDDLFKRYCFQAARIKEQFRFFAVGTKVSGISKSSIAKIELFYPLSKDEQYAIASALSDVDEMLIKLDQLIAKKRDLKQAAMQQLLTGQTRLPGFSGAWEVKPMKSLGNIYGGLVGKTKVDFGHGQARYIPFMNVMAGTVIDTEWLESVDVSAYEMHNLARKGDLFFNASSETPEEVGFCSVLLEDVQNLYLNSFCFGFRFNSEAKVNGLFFAYWFRSLNGRKSMAVLAQGATRYNIAKSAFLRLEIPQPSAKEQAAIATVLSDMDAEITALEARRDKTRALKQGMMQELLTGRIRLV